jgi:hypothetical protein
MPHFTLQISPQGAIMNAYISISDGRKMALASAGMTIPNEVLVHALVDTGASATCVDPSVLQALALTPTGSTMVRTPSTGNQPVPFDQYDVSLGVPPASAQQLPLYIGTLPVICTELLTSQGFHVLVGRDVLSQCLLIYNGTTNLFTLSY